MIPVDEGYPAIEWRLVHHDERGTARLLFQPVLKPAAAPVVHIPMVSTRHGDVQPEDSHRPVISGCEVQRAGPWQVGMVGEACPESLSLVVVPRNDQQGLPDLR